MFRFCLLIVLVGLSGSISAWARNKPPIVIKHSTSPDGGKNIVIVEGDENTGAATGIARIRDINTRKVLGSFAWSGFGVHPDAEAFEVLWRPDSRCFAINWEITRGFVCFAVYIRSKSGWVEVELPDLSRRALELAQAAGPDRVTIDENWGGKGHETARAWLRGNRLRVDTAYRGIEEVNTEGHQGFRFTLEISNSAPGGKPKAIVKDARLAPPSPGIIAPGNKP